VIGDAACPEWGADYGASLDADVSADVKTFMLSAGKFSELADEMVGDRDLGDVVDHRHGGQCNGRCSLANGQTTC